MHSFEFAVMFIRLSNFSLVFPISLLFRGSSVMFTQHFRLRPFALDSTPASLCDSHSLRYKKAPQTTKHLQEEKYFANRKFSTNGSRGNKQNIVLYRQCTIPRRFNNIALVILFDNNKEIKGCFITAEKKEIKDQCFDITKRDVQNTTLGSSYAKLVLDSGLQLHSYDERLIKGTRRSLYPLPCF